MRMWFVMIVTVLFIGVGVISVYSAKLQAAAPVAVQEIWHDNTLVLYDAYVGDGCHLYIARGYVGISGKDASPAMVAGPGCQK